MSEATLRVEGVTKAFGSVVALNAVSVEFLPGEVHAVLGENGAGKSTLMNVLGGFLTPDEGTVSYRGEALPLGQAAEMRQRGFAMVHQHFMLVPNFTVGENLALDALQDLRGRLAQPDLIASALERAKSLGWSIDVDDRTDDLPVGTQQRIEILKALAGPSDVIIFDEPTAVLVPSEVEELLGLLRRLAEEGRIVILIAHKLSEILAVADRITVLRRGRVVAQTTQMEANAAQIAEWMVGDVPAPQSPLQEALGEKAVRVKDLVVSGDRGEPAVRGISFEIRSGEVLGIGGVDGNGQTELAEAVAGIRSRKGGDIVTPNGVAFIPPDRQRAGLALSLSVEDNLWSGPVQRRQGLVLNRKRLWNWSRGVVQDYEIKVGNLSDPVRSLSGGNQQKVVVGRELSESPGLLVVVNPTRGLDVRATEFVHRRILDAARAGAAVLLISTDSDELAALAHRILYLSRGELRDSLVGATA
ncbi:MAG: ATP-binding cassette domain-containing protein [Fimbriimonadaceae bacterium]|nr:ATP-binding cassette domain-containing protein [Fimbriimonadaceae bacterium]